MNSNYVTPSQLMVEDARRWNGALITAKRYGDIPATEAAMRSQRNYCMKRARELR